MSAINEAYARIDFATIQELQNKINDLEKRIPSGVFSKIRGTDYSINNTRVFAAVIPVPTGTDNTFRVNFGSGTFSSLPIVTVTVGTNLDISADTELPNLVVRDLTRTSVVVEMRRKNKKALRLHVIAVGER